MKEKNQKTSAHLFKGKTIRRVDTKACNVWYFHFDDGSVVYIEVEAMGAPGLYGLVAREELIKGNTP